MKEDAIYVNTARAMLHDTDALVARARSPATLGGAGLDHFEGENLPTDHPLQLDAERRAHAAHRRRDVRHRGEPLQADRRRRSTQLLAGGKPDNLVNPEVLLVSLVDQGTAQEIKEELLWVAKEMLRTNLVTAPPATSRRACPTATSCSRRRRSPTTTMTLDDLVVVRPRRQRARGRARSDDREGAAPRLPCGVRRHPRRRCTATPKFCHDVRADAHSRSRP